MNFKEANDLILNEQEHTWYELHMGAYRAFGVIIFKPICETCKRKMQCALCLENVEKCNFYVDESRSIKVVEDAE